MKAPQTETKWVEYLKAQRTKIQEAESERATIVIAFT